LLLPRRGRYADFSQIPALHHPQTVKRSVWRKLGIDGTGALQLKSLMITKENLIAEAVTTKKSKEQNAPLINFYSSNRSTNGRASLSLNIKKPNPANHGSQLARKEHHEAPANQRKFYRETKTQ
jgi:hypothetical protein